MKKKCFIPFIIMCLFVTNAIAQEKVRGIETKLVQYDYDNDYRRDIYGIQFTNLNSISVSVTIELWKRGEYSTYYDRYAEDKIAITKDIVLKPNESYLWKIGKAKSSDGELQELRCYSCSHYYYRYEAYKLQ